MWAPRSSPQSPGKCAVRSSRSEQISHSSGTGPNIVAVFSVSMDQSRLAVTRRRRSRTASSAPRNSPSTAPTGFHLETLIASDLLVWRDGSPSRDLHHWRLSSGQEVDFILEENGQLLPVEVKAGNSVGADEARHLVTFRERHGNTPRAVLLSCDPQIRVIRPGILACPWWAVM